MIPGCRSSTSSLVRSVEASLVLSTVGPFSGPGERDPSPREGVGVASADRARGWAGAVVADALAPAGWWGAATDSRGLAGGVVRWPRCA